MNASLIKEFIERLIKLVIVLGIQSFKHVLPEEVNNTWLIEESTKSLGSTRGRRLNPYLHR